MDSGVAKCRLFSQAGNPLNIFFFSYLTCTEITFLELTCDVNHIVATNKKNIKHDKLKLKL